MPDGSKYADEVERIRNVYRRFEQEGRHRSTWAPFQEDEVSVRAQQLLVFASLLRRIGRLDLANWHILDVGCGKGRLLRSFVDAGADPANLFGTDINESWLKEAAHLSPRMNFQLTDGVNLPFSDGHFDLISQYVVFSSIRLQSLRLELAGEMWRVLKKGGYLFWWDMPHMAHDAGGSHCRLSYSGLFPFSDVKEYPVGVYPMLCDFRGGRLIQQIWQYIGGKPHHVGALIGPKQ